MKGRNAKTIRTYQLISILEGAPHGLTVTQILSRLLDRGFDVTKKTVYRDMDGLKTMGVHLIEKGRDDDNGVRWAIEKNTKIGHYLILSAKELMALYFAKGALSPLKDTPFYKDLDSTFKKIEEQVPKDGREFLEEVSSELHFDAGPKWGLGLDPEILDTVRSACTERHLLKINYSSNNSQTTRDRLLGPKFMYFAQSSLYLVAEEIESGVTKTFSLPRVNAAEMMDDPYDGEETDPDQYFGKSFGVYSAETSETVVLEFKPPVAAFVKERQWHDSQVVVEKGDGVIEVRFELGVTPELLQWVLGYGSDVKVLQPVGLKEMLLQRAAEVVALYDDRKKAK